MKDLTERCSRVAALRAVMDIGTSCRLSLRRVAVTTTSSSWPAAGVALCARAMVVPNMLASASTQRIEPIFPPLPAGPLLFEGQPVYPLYNNVTAAPADQTRLCPPRRPRASGRRVDDLDRGIGLETFLAEFNTHARALDAAKRHVPACRCCTTGASTPGSVPQTEAASPSSLPFAQAIASSARL